MRSFAFITSNSKSGRLSMLSCTKATQSSRRCGVLDTSLVSVFFFSNPSDLNHIRSMRSFAFITSNTKSGRLSMLSCTKATQSSRCCGVASIMLHFVQISNLLSPRENMRVFK
ncbi:hypothetical protein AVEN_184683-1 [Araneus ventricosus]|uniref:Uncharacterized protein n=1 Tax=Araneus ventricosus TaxID=182803 RepID=A0A4Y2FSI2_ARAVE|nr:hypothetical protein AVEN_184683-1 [Araneus ventricosus]